MRELLFFYACGYINTFGKVNEELKYYAGRILANGHECSFYNEWEKELSEFYGNKSYMKNLKRSEKHDFEDFLSRYGKWAKKITVCLKNLGMNTSQNDSIRLHTFAGMQPANF